MKPLEQEENLYIMNFLGRNKKFSIGFLLYSLILIIIITFLNIFTNIEWLGNISIVISIGSFLGMIVIFIIQMNKSEEQSKVLISAKEAIEKADTEIKNQSVVLASAKETIDEAKSKIQKNQEGIEKVQAGQSTKVLKDFPYNIPDITEKLKETSIKKDGILRKIIISTDVTGYGVLSNNKAFNIYFDELSRIAKDKETNNIDIQWYFYNDKLQNEQSSAQFAAFTPSFTDTEDVKKRKLEAFEQYITEKRADTNVRLSCNVCTNDNVTSSCLKRNRQDFPCYIIKSIDEGNPRSLTAALNSLEYIIKRRLSNIPEIDQFHLTEKLPFFSWIILEYLEGNEKATEAIICYPAYKEGSSEKCFYTSSPSLTEMFYSIVKDFTDEKSTLIHKQEDKEDEYQQPNIQTDSIQEKRILSDDFFKNATSRK